MNKFNLKFVTFFGLGNIKYAPGSFASGTVCILCYFLIKNVPNSFLIMFVIFLAILFYAPVAIRKTLKNFNIESSDQMVNQEEFTSDDPKQIVVDEVLGMLIPLFFLSLAFEMSSLPILLQKITSIVWFMEGQTLVTELYAILYLKFLVFIYFLLFRFFDIFKPFPIGYVDKNFKGSFGIILDDIIAGIYCLLFPFILLICSLIINSFN